MSKLEKLLEKIKNNPKSVRFAELDRILTIAGFVRRQPRAALVTTSISAGIKSYVFNSGNRIFCVFM